MDKLSKDLVRVAFHDRLSRCLRPCFVSYREASESVGCNYSTFRNWAAGTSPIPPYARLGLAKLTLDLSERVQFAAAVCLIRTGAFEGHPSEANPWWWANKARPLRQELRRSLFRLWPRNQVREIRMLCMRQKTCAEAITVDYGRFRTWTARSGWGGATTPYDMGYWRLATFLLAWRDALGQHPFRDFRVWGALPIYNRP